MLLTAVAMGAITQVRVLGRVVGIEIAQVMLPSTIRRYLPDVLLSEAVNQLLVSAASISKMSPSEAKEVRRIYGHTLHSPA